MVKQGQTRPFASRVLRLVYFINVYLVPTANTCNLL